MGNEVWRSVVGFEGLYEVSDRGRVRSLARFGRPTIILKIQYNITGGYASISMSRNSRGRAHKVHVLVAAAFLGPRPAGTEILHADDDKRNCAVSNLRYGTRSENLHDRVKNGIHHHARKTHCKNNEDALQEQPRVHRREHPPPA